MLSLHKFLRTVFLLLVCVAICATANSQENCANGKDDDNDGLIDLQDADCQCRYVVDSNLLLNGSFESFDHCPVYYTYLADSAIIYNWHYGTYTNTNEANFYHNFNCSEDSLNTMLYMPPTRPLTDGQAFISIRNNPYLHPLPANEVTKSYVGQCLQKPLKKGVSYTLEFFAGRFRSWDNLTGKVFPFTVAIYGNAACNAVPFGKAYAIGNGCPANYQGWYLLGSTTIHNINQWVQSKITFTAPADLNVVEIGSDCTTLPAIVDLTDSTTFLDYHVFYIDDVHLLPTEKFPFAYIHPKAESSCSNQPMLLAPTTASATYQWYKDSVALPGATGETLQLKDVAKESFYNVKITTGNKCVISEPFFVATSNLSKISIDADAFICGGETLTLANAVIGITYLFDGNISDEVVITKPGFYTIVATDAFGCSKTFTTNVSQENCSECNAFIPAAFTPNGDGLNDLFRAKINCRISNYSMRIYSRVGEKIFESKDVNAGWNGLVSGMVAPTGTYVYTVTYTAATGVKKLVKGVVVLMR